MEIARVGACYDQIVSYYPKFPFSSFDSPAFDPRSIHPLCVDLLDYDTYPSLIPRIDEDAVLLFFCLRTERPVMGLACCTHYSSFIPLPLSLMLVLTRFFFRFFLPTHRLLCLARQSVGCYLGFLSLYLSHTLLFVMISLIFLSWPGGWTGIGRLLSFSLMVISSGSGSNCGRTGRYER